VQCGAMAWKVVGRCAKLLCCARLGRCAWLQHIAQVEQWRHGALHSEQERLMSASSYYKHRCTQTKGSTHSEAGLPGCKACQLHIVHVYMLAHSTTNDFLQ
jgi:hypothetical protein